MKVLHDLDFQKVATLKNALIEDTFASAPAAHFSHTNGTASGVGLICHYDGSLWIYAKTVAGGPGNEAWTRLATAGEVFSFDTANRLLVTNGANQPIVSANFGYTAEGHMDFEVSGSKKRIINLADPINEYDAANKRYVDSLAAGLKDQKNSCVFTTQAATGGTFNAGTGRGVILNAPVENFDTTGVTVVVGMRVLVKDQALADKEQNGIYEVTAVDEYEYDLERTTDAYVTGDLSDGTFVFVEKGDASRERTSWVIVDSGIAPTINTDDLTFVLFHQAGTISAGAGLTLTGNVLDVNPDNVTIHITSDQVAVKPATANRRILLTNTANVGPVWGQVDLNATDFFSGVLPPVLGGTGRDSSLVTKGSLLYTSATGTWDFATPNGAGTTKQVLVADKTAQTLTWTDTTGSTSVVLNDGPTLLNSLNSTSGTFTLLNTSVTTLNAFGAATTATLFGAVTTLNFGNGLAAKTVNMFTATGMNTSTFNFVTGEPNVGATHTINIGTGAGMGTTRNINIGSDGAGGYISLFSPTRALNEFTVADAFFKLFRNGATTTILQLSLSGLTTGTKTWTVQNQSGTVALLGNKISDFTECSSSELAGKITDETGTGLLVFNTSPIFTTGVGTTSSTFSLFNGNAGTLNAFAGTATATILPNVTVLYFGSQTTAAQQVDMFSTSTGTSTYNFAVGPTGGGNTKTLNIGTGGAFSSTTNINIGSSSGSGTIALNQNTTIAGSLAVFDTDKFSIKNQSQPTSVAQFDASGITPGNTRTFAFPSTSGTLALRQDKLSVFAVTSATELRTVVTENTGTGNLVFAASPTFTTSVLTTSTTFSVFNTTATTVNAFGAATALNIATTATAGGTYNFVTGTTSSGQTKTVNIGTGGAAGSTTNVNIGSSAASAGAINLYGATAGITANTTITGTLNVTGALTANTLNTRDSTFVISDDEVGTRQFKFEASGITAGNVRTLTVPNASGTIALLSNKISDFAAVTSAELAGKVSDETGTGVLVFNYGPTIFAPRIQESIRDTNGTIMVGLTPTASAVNYFNLTNSATAAGNVYLGTLGTDSNIGLQFQPKGTGATPSAWGALTWKDQTANTSQQVLRLCRVWSMTLSTGALDRNNNALTLGTSMDIYHNFGTTEVSVQVIATATGEVVLVDWENEDTSHIVLKFKTTPASGAYRVTIIG